MERMIVTHLYSPGSAATNRILAYALGFASQGINVSLILGNQIAYEAPTLDDEGRIRVFMVQASHGYRLNQAMANKVKELYKGASTAILIYGTPALCWFLPNRRYHIFYECTEVPFYGRKKTFTSWVKEKIKVYLAKRATGMLVISNALVKYFKGQGIKNIAVINMFVDTNRFDNVKTDTKEKYIAYCGKVSLHKDGVDDLIRAFKLFFDVHNDYSLWIIGGFENAETQTQLQQLVQLLHLEKAVRFVGQVNPQDMPVLLKSAHVLALARPNNKQAQFGFPTKLGEYLATGKPVVVTKVGEIGDFLVDGVNCRMAEPDNPADFAEKLSWIADHYSEALEVGQKGKQLTESEFSSLVQSEKAIEFMNFVIES